MEERIQQTEAAAGSAAMRLRRVATWHGVRVLAWHGDVLYGCSGYTLIAISAKKLQLKGPKAWTSVADFRPAWWRSLTSRSSFTYRLVRDGFHALAVLDDKTMTAAVPGAIVTRSGASGEFRVTHKVLRGTRPLHITAVPGGNIYWGEYFDNRERSEVHIYASADRGQTWNVAHTFPTGAIRHVHNIVYDRWAECLWIFTGDDGAECRVLRASCDLRIRGTDSFRQPAGSCRCGHSSGGCDLSRYRYSFRAELRSAPGPQWERREGSGVGQFVHFRLPRGRWTFLHHNG